MSLIIYDMEAYLERLGPNAAIKSVAELMEKTGQKPSVFDRYKESLPDPDSVPDLSIFVQVRTKYLQIFNEVMDEHKLDGLVFPQMFKETPLLDSKDNIGATTVSEINSRCTSCKRTSRILFKRFSFCLSIYRKNVE
ncbi:hypothetical protein [Paenibacillus validus]|uniref:hypothetical protein n=1 Tax=Paenibacillus validus TaxID=44253 RepID=UPI003D26AF8D